MVIVIFAGNNPFVFSLDFRNFAETKQTHPIDMQSIKHNYLIYNKIGGGVKSAIHLRSGLIYSGPRYAIGISEAAFLVPYRISV